ARTRMREGTQVLELTQLPVTIMRLSLGLILFTSTLRLCVASGTPASESQTPSQATSTAIVEAHPTLSLDGTWRVMPLPLSAEGEAGYAWFMHTNSERLAAQVPGEIHLDLMRAGKMEDPDIGDNARRACRWPENYSWWYRTEFVVPVGFRQ